MAIYRSGNRAAENPSLQEKKLPVYGYGNLWFRPCRCRSVSAAVAGAFVVDTVCLTVQHAMETKTDRRSFYNDAFDEGVVEEKIFSFMTRYGMTCTEK